MEASVSVGPPPHERAAQSRLLRLGTDDQLVALFRSGYDEAFETIHDRYHAPLFGYARQLLRHSNADAEDAVQEVFWRASRSLRKDDREIVLRPWLYRVAHNYCFDQLRRPELQLCDLQDICRSPHRDPALEAEQRESFRRLVTDLERLPDQQRSALLMHIDGLRYVEIADALGISAFAVKSGVNRARGNLRAANEAREAACADIRADLDRAHARKVRMSGRSRRHLSDCTACTTYKADLRRADQTMNSLAPADPGMFAGLTKLLGIGGGAAAGGGSVAATTISVSAPIAAKMTAIVCCAVLVGSGANGLRENAAQPPRAAVHGQEHAGPAPSQPDNAGITHVDPRGPAQAGSVYATRSYPTARAPKVPPSHPAPVSPSAYSRIAPKPGTMTAHWGAGLAQTNYTSTADAARQTGGVAAPEDTPATNGDPVARDEATPSGATADADTAAGPEVQSVPVGPATNPKPQQPADGAPAAPASSPTPVLATGASTTPSSQAPATPSESGGGAGTSTAAASASTAP